MLQWAGLPDGEVQVARAAVERHETLQTGKTSGLVGDRLALAIERDQRVLA